MSYEYLIAPSTLRRIVRHTCGTIWITLQPLYMPEKKEDWIEIANQFYDRTDFPNVIGAIDGKHMRIERPNHAGS